MHTGLKAALGRPLAFTISFVGPLFEPWRSLRGRRFQFISWLMVVTVIGLAGFLIPLMLLYVRGMPVYPEFEQALRAGNVASFCVAVLAEGLVALLIAERGGTYNVARGIRGIVGGGVIGLVIVLVGVIGIESASSSGPHVAISFHLGLAALTICIAAYLYCFRWSSWEEHVKTAEEAKEEEDRQVDRLGQQAQLQSSAGGVKL